MEVKRRNALIALLICVAGVWGALFGVVCFNSYVLMSLSLIVRMLMMIVTYWGILVVPIVLMAVSKTKPADIGFSRENLGIQIAVGVCIGVVMSLVLTLAPILFGVGDWVDNGRRYTEWWQFLYDFVYCIAAVGLVEEVIFRGYIPHKLKQLKNSELLAGVVSSVLFGFFHIFGGNIVQVLITSVLGGMWYLCREKIKYCSLLSLIIAHGVYDALISVWSSTLIG